MCILRWLNNFIFVDIKLKQNSNFVSNQEVRILIQEGKQNKCYLEFLTTISILVKSTIKSFFKERTEVKGDGLHSIYTDVAQVSPIATPIKTFEYMKRPTVNDEKDFILDYLNGLSGFGGIDISRFHDICYAAESQTKKKNEIIYDTSDTADKLYILVSGTCKISVLDDDAKETELTKIEAKTVVGGVIDIISWLLGSEMKRCVTVTCFTDTCSIILLPSPKVKALTNNNHITSYCKMLRQLHMRLNRTTFVTAYCYVGLTDSLLSTIYAIKIPEKLKKMVLKDDWEQNEDELMDLVYECVGEMIGMEANCCRTCDCKQSPQTSSQHLNKNNNLNLIESQSSLQTIPLRRSLSDSSTSIRSLNWMRSNSIESDHSNKGWALNTPTVRPEIFPVILTLQEGELLLDINDKSSIFILISGQLKIECNNSSSNLNHPISILSSLNSIMLTNKLEKKMITSHMYYSGSVIGYISTLSPSDDAFFGTKCNSNNPIVTTVTAISKSFLIQCSRRYYETILARRPHLYINFAEKLLLYTPPIIRLLDTCCRLIRKNGGDDLTASNIDEMESLYVLLSGKLRIFPNKKLNSYCKCCNEGIINFQPVDQRCDNCVFDSGCNNVFERGTLLGGSKLIRSDPTHPIIKTMRSCTLIRLPQALVSCIVHDYPLSLSHISRNLLLTNSWGTKQNQNGRSTSKAIAILPITGSVPLDLFSSLLYTSMRHVNSTVKLLTSASMRTEFDEMSSASENELFIFVETWLHSLEAECDVLLYQCDWQQGSVWNRLCLGQADEVLLVGNSVDAPNV